MRFIIKKSFYCFVLSVFLAVLFPNIIFADENGAGKIEKHSPENLEKEKLDILEKTFLSAVEAAVRVGYDYVSNVKNFPGKKYLLEECGIKYTESYLHEFLEKDFSEDKVKLVDACISNSGHPKIVENDSLLSDFKGYWSEYKVSDGGYAILLGYGETVTSVKVPHPLLIVNKIAAELGSFTFVDSARPTFGVYVAKGINIMLDKSSYGDLQYKKNMKKVLADLKVLFERDTRFQQDFGLEENAREAKQQIPDSILVDLGGLIHYELSASKNTVLLTNEEKLKLGTLAASDLFPTYSCLLNLKKYNVPKLGKDCAELDRKEAAALGKKLVATTDGFVGQGLKNSGDAEGDIDVKYSAIETLVSYYIGINLQDQQSNVRREQYKVANPLQDTIDNLALVLSQN